MTTWPRTTTLSATSCLRLATARPSHSPRTAARARSRQSGSRRTGRECSKDSRRLPRGHDSGISPDTPSGEMKEVRRMTEPTLDPLVERATLSNDVAYEVLSCDPDKADTAAFCAHYGFSIEQAANTILVV